jgi:hypothetical protein
VAAFVAAVAAIVVPTASAGAKNECNGIYTNTTFKGGLVVNPGDFCVLNNVTVNGGFTVNGSDGNFPFLVVNNSTIHGGWSITGGIIAPNYFCGNNVDGGLTVNNVDNLFGIFAISFGEANAGCAGGTINGGASFTNITASTELDAYTVNGGVTFANVNGNINEIEGSTIHGSASCDAASNVVNDSYTTDGPPSPNSYTGTNNGCPA